MAISWMKCRVCMKRAGAAVESVGEGLGDCARFGGGLLFAIELIAVGFVLVFVFFAEGGWPGVARRQLTFFCFAKRK
ncbi:hypothetical protein [Polaromonas sp. YR568]|uniref:hypothetical protein n=1 Tax=Polaromonas sp. YR568 TaxID=1855301 RepID=UPI001587A64B|nr:hypothetical protein [Polaromonas sp. YR568]